MSRNAAICRKSCAFRFGSTKEGRGTGAERRLCVARQSFSLIRTAGASTCGLAGSDIWAPASVRIGRPIRVRRGPRIDDDGPGGPSSPFWRTAENLMIAGYGASRNFSDSDDRSRSISDMVQAHISLFDPMARIARAAVLLNEKAWRA